MNPRYFNSIMPRVHEEWVANVLKMEWNRGNGPDLIDEKKIVEVKSCLFPNKKNYMKWNILEHQMNYPEIENKPGFWAAMNYSISKPVSQINVKNRFELEKLVLERTLHILPWAWARQFKPHETQVDGPSDGFADDGAR